MIGIFKNRIENKIISSIVEWLVCIAGAVLLFLFINNFIFKVAKVDGSSMQPTLHHNDKIIVNRLSHFFGGFDRGDIIAFPYSSDPEKNYVKRIIAKAGDTVDLQDYAFYVNGEKLNDDYSNEPVRNFGNVDFPVTVPEDSYFVLGDNRNGSEDSRYIEVGFIKKKDIIGKTNIRIMPIDNIGLFN